MTFKVIKRFLAIQALIKSLAGCRTKFADTTGMVGMAMRATYCFFQRKPLRMTHLLPG